MMQIDVVSFVESCERCQKHGNLIHAPSRELIPSISHWSFQHWAFDLVGKIHPKSSSGHNFIITTTDYFTKWVEALPFSIASRKKVSLFILNHVIYRYGVPFEIITHNGG